MYRPVFPTSTAFLLALTWGWTPTLQGQEQPLSLPSGVVAEWEPGEEDVLSRPARLHVQGVILADALRRLEESAGVKVGYSPSLLPKNTHVTCECREATVGQAVGVLLRGTGLEISVLNDYVVIRERRIPESPVLNVGRTPDVNTHLVMSRPLRMTSLQEAQGTITGSVLDAQTQQPLGVAQVYVSGLNVGVLSSSDGTYQIPNVPAGTHTISAELIGYAPQSQQVTVVSGETVLLDFALVTQALSLDELIVVGYGTQSQATVSGSVSQVTSSTIERNSASAVATALVGRVQGINTRMHDGFNGITTAGGTDGRIPGDITDGRPGSTTGLQIRNMGEPLFVIDGVPTTDAQEFNHLNAADIENISVLKDASAAVYGFRAANGVVLVETKRGASDQPPEIRLDGWYGWQNIERYHFADLMNAYEFQFSRVDSNNNRNQNPSITPEELELWRTGAPGYESTDHWDQVNTPNAPEYNLNASISGGASNARYYLSVGHVNQTYNYNPDDNKFNRTNLTANLETSLTDRLTIGTELKARYERHDNVAVVGDTDPIRTFILTIHSSWPHQNPYTGPDNNLINRNVRRLERSVAILNQDVSGLQEDDRRQASGNFWAEYRFPFGLTAKATASVSNRLRQFDLARKSFNAWSCNADNTECTEFPGNPSQNRNQLKNVHDEVFGQVALNYAQQFGGHSFSGSAFWEAQGSETTETWTIGVTPTNYSPLFGLTDIQDLGNAWGISRRASVGGRLDYDFDQKYLVSALARYDGSYLYAEGKRWGFFPGLSLGWRLTEEPFLQDKLGFLNELKIRGSWGQAGREQGIQNWGYLGGATYNVGNGSAFDGSLVTGARPRGLPVTNLTWVTSETSNIGLDVVLLDGRLSGSFDLFERRLDGLPAARTDVLVPTEVGYSLPNENLNSDTNRGFEGVLRWSDRIGGLSYSFAPNITLSRLKNGFRYGERYGNSWDRYVNGEVGRWDAVDFGYRVIGQFQTVEEIENHLVDQDGRGNSALLPGDLIYEDVNGDGVINNMDQRPIGFATTGTPIMSFGAVADANYRGFSLSVVLAGGALYSFQRGAATKFPSGHNLPTYATDRWHRVDPYNPQSEWQPGRYPPFRSGGFRPSFVRDDDFWTVNVKYLRVRRVELGYEVPNWFSNRFALSDVRVYSSLSNPFSFDNVGYFNQDPEVAQDPALVYPTISVFNIGITTNVGGF